MRSPRLLWIAVVGIVGCAAFRLGEPAAVDLNRADTIALEGLPGITRSDAERIVAGRPYAAKDDLLRRRVLSAAKYDALADHVYVGPPGMPDYLRSTPPPAEAH